MRQEGSESLPPNLLEEAAVIIEATVKHQLPNGLSGEALEDAALFLDMDLSILATRPDVFDGYEQQIRTEYLFVPEEVYRSARAGILKGFLAREQLYFTTHFRSLWETQPRDNLARSIRALEP